ncbi:hypothetical protein A2U01_0086995, partial [Trifolium medium]|nr:hypothetical protein [Trifolium medium]
EEFKSVELVQVADEPVQDVPKKHEPVHVQNAPVHGVNVINPRVF